MELCSATLTLTLTLTPARHRHDAPALLRLHRGRPPCGARPVVSAGAVKPSPKGFGAPNPQQQSSSSSQSSAAASGKTKKKGRRKNGGDDGEEDEDEDEDEDDDDDDTVPQVVTDRMLKRIGYGVGIPLGLGLALFPVFYYLKVQLKVDVPEWLPLLVSGLFFGSSGFGITYGIVSTSWDPNREGSILGWTEAQANWPLFFNNLQPQRPKKPAKKKTKAP